MWGLIGVGAFSFTIPLTRVAVRGERLSPLFVGSGRAVVAAALAALALLATHQRPPQGRQWISVLLVAAGSVAGFPVLTSYALTVVPASHGAVVLAILPVTTAACAILRTREHPGRGFWPAAGAGLICAVAFAIIRGGDVGHLEVADALLLGAVLVCAIAYAEGGVLARSLGAWQTISWALVVAVPAMTLLTSMAWRAAPPSGTPTEWLSFGYLGVVSMFLGFVAWYRGLAIGAMAQVSQVQLIQPVLSLCWAAAFLGEEVTVMTVCGGVSVILCALIAVRSR